MQKQSKKYWMCRTLYLLNIYHRRHNKMSQWDWARDTKVSDVKWAMQSIEQINKYTQPHTHLQPARETLQHKIIYESK